MNPMIGSPTALTYSARRWYMRGLAGTAVTGLLLAIPVASIALWGSSSQRSVLTIFLINLVMVLGIQVFMGNSGVVTLGHISFVALASYITGVVTVSPALKATMLPDAPGYIRNATLGFWPAMVLAVSVVALIGALIGVVLVRLSGAAAAIATFGLMVITRQVLSNAESITRGSQTFYGVPAVTTIPIAFGAVVLAVLVARLFKESPVGLRLRATKSDELAARTMGVNVFTSRLAAWTVSAAVVAAGGVLQAHYLLAFAPEQFFFTATFTLLVMVILGGSSVTGAVVGATVVTAAMEMARTVQKGVTLGPISTEGLVGLAPFALAGIVLLSMALRPYGIVGRWELDEALARLMSPRDSRRSAPSEATKVSERRGGLRR